MENPIKMDDLGGETPIFGNTHVNFSAARIDESSTYCWHFHRLDAETSPWHPGRPGDGGAPFWKMDGKRNGLLAGPSDSKNSRFKHLPSFDRIDMWD